MDHPLPFAMNTRLSADQRQLLEETASALDLTLSGAIRWHLDQVLDRPLVEGKRRPTRRELMHDGEVTIDGEKFTLTSVTLAEDHAEA